MPRYRYVGDDVRNFPSLGLYEVEPGFEFDTDRPVASPLIVTAEGEATHVDADGAELGEPDNNADPNPDAGLVSEDDSASEPIADYTLEDLSREELYELAGDLDVHGRSRMDKAELVEALREAAQQTPAAIDAAVATIGQTEHTEPVAGEGDDTSTEE